MKNSKGFVFVLMPFDTRFNDIYHFGIKKTCNDLNFYCERVDEQVFEGIILTRIYNQIRTADLIVADMSYMNPNVFYETGYAHALGKDVILLTQNASDIPFDLKHYPHIVYDNKIKFLSSELSKKLQWFIDHKATQNNECLKDVEIFNNGKLIEKEGTIVANWIEKESVLYYDSIQKGFDEIVKEKAELKISFNLFNKGFKKIENFSDIVLILENVFHEEKFISSDSYSFIKLPDNNVLIRIDDFYNLSPKTWTTLEINLGEKKFFKKEFNKCIIRIISDGNIHDIPLNVEYKYHRIITTDYD